ncbi:MAG: S9 family peptidase [Chitinophagaceae bacterium]|nr:S9 family peptidase [Chitinophagaceae bacterium]
MKNYRLLLLLCILLSINIVSAQQQLAPLTVEKIMRDPGWIGTSPSEPHWSHDGKILYFNWNPDQFPADSLYRYTISAGAVAKVETSSKNSILYADELVYNRAGTAYVYARQGDVFWADVKGGITKQVTETAAAESNPVFAFGDSCVVYQRDLNLYAWNIRTGVTKQLSNFLEGAAPAADKKLKGNTQEEWLKKDQLEWLRVLKERKDKKAVADLYEKRAAVKSSPREIYTGDRALRNVRVSPDGRYITYNLHTSATNAKHTVIPDYVTESGFTEDIQGRTKVGAPLGYSEFFIFDRQKDTVIPVKMDSLPGIRDLPDYVKDYPLLQEQKKKFNPARHVTVAVPVWSASGRHVVLDIKSVDNKDRWLMKLDPASGKLSLLDRQRDEAWISGPGLYNKGWIDENTCWFQSEASGYSHLYSINVETNQKKSLTAGNYEVQKAVLSKNKKCFYISTNQPHPGERHFYRLCIADGKTEKLTGLTGANDVILSPDEKQIAILYSYSNKPWELYLQEAKVGALPRQLTFKAQSEAFRSYPWREPEIVTVQARDGKQVYARLYKPADPHPAKPAVIFVHGAGYLQNAHKWWSSYFREYMFHNLLADNGYFVLDMDYRASAGYGRDWRTGIYRFMGGKDLTDNIDGAAYLVKTCGVDPKRIGIYGGSYGGFITLMALFTSPGTFAAGAALRPVTDWAHYNQGYTSNILNIPSEDSIAYRKSSPLYYAEGLQDELLICHGVVDVNVHFQDVMRLNQRLIESGKNNWEVAMYPVEDHGFVEPSSWTDEYKRILKLFERVLKK